MTSSRPGGSSLRRRRIDVGLADAADLAAWQALADQAIEPNPYYRPGFLVADAIERGVPMELLIVEDESGWLACLPIRGRGPSRTLPLPHLQNVTDEYVLLGTPLVLRGSVDRAIDGLLDEVRAVRRAAALMIDVLPADGPVATALVERMLARHVRPVVHHTYERAAWRRADDGPSPGPRLKRAARKELGRRARLLVADLGGDLEVVDRTHEPGAIAAFVAMEGTGWKAERGTAIASRPADAAFFRRACEALSDAGNVEFLSLDVRGRPVAMECHLVDGGVLFSFRIAHDPDYRRGSPGTQLKARVIESFDARGFRLADSCASPRNTHMNRLWPDRRPMTTILVPTGAITSRLIRPAVAGRSAARRIRDDVIRRGRRADHESP